MKRLILSILLVGLCVAPAMGSRTTFQDYTNGTWYDTLGLAGGFTTQDNTFLPGHGMIVSYLNGARISNTNPSSYDYIAFDNPDHTGYDVVTLDSTGAIMLDCVTGAGANRTEIKLTSTSGKVYEDGIYTGDCINTGSPTAYPVNVLMFGLGAATADSILFQEADRHMVSTMPVNHSVMRDYYNPAATGMYGWNPSTSAWVSVNSLEFTVDADKEYNLSENVKIANLNTGVVVNTTSASETHNYVQYNISQFLNTPTSMGTTIPDGQYKVYWEGSPAIYDTFWVTSVGAVINWDQTTYPNSATGTLTYTISPGYFDLTNFDYKVQVVDIYGTVLQTTAINVDTGTVSVPISAASFPPGVYYGEVIRTEKSTSVVSYLAYDSMSVTGYVSFTGFVNNAENATFIKSATVNVSQSSRLWSTSGKDGNWSNANNWLTGSLMNITTNKTSYTTDVRGFTPLVSKVINMNISLLMTTPAYSGAAIGGIVRDNVYGDVISGATYNIENGTEYNTSVTNLAGFARYNATSPTVLYNVWASKTGYANSTIVQVKAVDSAFTRQDLVMTPQFTKTINFVDSETNLPVPVVLVIDSNGYNETTSAGTFVHTYPYGTYLFYFTATGYVSRAVSYIIDSDSTDTVQLTKSLTDSTSGKLNLLYPHEVQFTIVNPSGKTLDGVNVTAVMLTSSVSNTNWYTTLFGISSEATPVNSTTMYAISDDAGSFTFPMISSGRYMMTFTEPSQGISESRTVSPQQANYVYVLTPTASLIPNMGDYINGTLFVTPNGSYIDLNFTYRDTSTHLTSVSFFASVSGGATIFSRTYTGSAGTVANTSAPVLNVGGTSYVWGYYANNTQFGNVSEVQGIIMKGASGKLVNLDPCGGYALGWGNEC